MKTKLSIVASLFAAVSGLHAQVVSISTIASSAYTQSFDGLGATTIASAFSATANTQTEISTLAGVTGIGGWYGTKLAGTGVAATGLTADAGTANSGGIYSYGVASAADRSLGTLASGTSIMGFGAIFKNDTLSTLDVMTFTLTAEFWRSSTTNQNVLTFAYGKVDGTTVTTSNFLSTGTATSFASLNITGPAPVVTNGALDGNLSANQVAFTGVAISGLAWAPGETVFIRWKDANETGNDAGLAIDNMTIGVSTVPEPTTWALIGLGTAFMMWNLRRKRQIEG